MELRTAICILLFLFPASVLAQDDLTQEVARRLEENRTQFPAMRPLVFFSQDKYAAGDTAFFRLFILTETERILAERSLLTLDLIHPNGAVVARQVVSCQRFGAANQLILSDTLTAGKYEVRLYANHMTQAYGLSAPLLIVRERELLKVANPNTTIRFFPEGGHLVPGVLGKVIVKVTGEIPAGAALHSEAGRVMPVSFSSNGMASIHFVPQAGHYYTLEYSYGSSTKSEPLPLTDPGGMTLRVYRGPRMAWVLDMAAGQYAAKTATLILISARQVLHSREVQFNAEGRANVLATADFFPGGYSELFLVNNERHVLAWRPVFVPVKPVVSVSISGIPGNVSLRKNVEAILSLTDDTGHAVTGGLSISVIPDETRLRSISVPEPTLELRSTRISIDQSLPADQLDMELLANAPPATLVPEYPVLIHNTNLTLTGKAYSTDPGSPLPYLSRLVIYLHNDLIQYETAIDGAGNFEFSKIYDFFGKDRAFYKAIHLQKDVPNVRVDWTLNHELVGDPSSIYKEGTKRDTYGQLRTRKRAVDRSYGFFLAPETPIKGVVNYNEKLEDEFQGADVVVNPSEYTPFQTMQELILEVVPMLKFRARSKDSVVEVSLDTHSPFVAQRYAEGNALFVIDGNITTNMRYLMSLSPQDVVSIKIINEIEKLNRLENLAPNGVVFVQTRNPERTRKDLAKEQQTVEGLSPTLIYHSRYPDKPRVPDLRTLLYWTPLIDSDTTGTVKVNFRTSDVPGKYWIRVMGTSTSGHLLAGEQAFEVTFK